MTDRINHYRTAEAALEEAMRRGFFGAWRWFRKAQAHALLALVEQQRIANLIALGRITDNSEWLPVAEARHVLVEVRPYVYQTLDGTKGEDEYEALRPDIAAALGIKEDQ